MLEVFVNFICAFILAITGFYVIRRFINSNQKINIKTLIIITINSFLIAIVHYTNYNFISLLLNFIINTMTYKLIFNDTVEEAVIQTGILIMYLIIYEILFVIIQIFLIPLHDFQNNLLIYLLYNIIIAVLSCSISHIKIINKNMNKVYMILLRKELKLNVLFILLVIIATFGISYSIITNNKFNPRFYSDIIVITSLITIGIIFINNRDTYNKLSNEYDTLLSNVSTFEEWIEKEQFNRHEYKNQLAVLYALSTEKRVKNKIEEIINQNLNIKNEVVNTLRDLPKGGLKGLLYYKTIVAEKHKLNITVNVSIKEKGILSKLSTEKVNTVAKLIGIFYDNAIDAAKESRKKILLIEIYELKDKVNIVISNTFKKSSIIERNFEKGISSKGEGHGNGLYFATKILMNNDWIEQKKEIIDNYYVETITIKKSTSKK